MNLSRTSNCGAERARISLLLIRNNGAECVHRIDTKEI